MKFSVCLSTGYEALVYPPNFCAPQDLVRQAQLAEKLGVSRSEFYTTALRAMLADKRRADIKASYDAAYADGPTDEERAWADGLEAELTAEASHRAASDDGDDGGDEWYDDEGDEEREDAVMAMTKLLRLLRRAQGEPAPRTR